MNWIIIIEIQVNHRVAFPANKNRAHEHQNLNFQ